MSIWSHPDNLEKWLDGKDQWFVCEYYGPFGWKGRHRVFSEGDRVRGLGCGGTVLSGPYDISPYGVYEVQFDRVVSVEDGIQYSKLFIGSRNLRPEICNN